MKAIAKTAASRPSEKKDPPRAARKSTSSPDQYTKPELREQIKERVQAADKGGAAGQWSARKAQLVAAEYEREGGGYKHPRTEAQEHLHEWTEEHWQTSDSQPARRGAATTRYLPAKAWEQLSPERKAATNRKKVKGSLEGKQFVPNTEAAAAALRSATHKQTLAKSKSRSSQHAEPTPKPTRTRRAPKRPPAP